MSVNELQLLKDSFIEFMNRVSTVLQDSVNTKWLEFKEQLLTKQPLDVYLWVSGMNYMRLSDQSSESTQFETPNRFQQLKIETTPSSKKELKQVKIKVFENVQKIKLDEVRRKGFQEIIISKKLDDRFKMLDQVRDAIKQFRNDGVTLGTVYEKSSEIETPVTPDCRRQTQPISYQQPLQVLMPQPFFTMKKYSVYQQRGPLRDIPMQPYRKVYMM